MPQKWLTIVDAAAQLGVSVRTLERRVVAGKFQQRHNEGGRREILVDVSEHATQGDGVAHGATEAATPAAADVAGVVEAAAGAVTDQANRQVSLAISSASALARVSQENADRALDELELARASARRAWWSVGGLGVAACVAVALASWSLSQWRERERHVSDTVARTAALQEQLVAAALERGRLEGRLSSHQEKAWAVVLTTRPATPEPVPVPATTRPSPSGFGVLRERIAAVFGGGDD